MLDAGDKRKKYLILALLSLGWFLENMERVTINYGVIGITRDLQLSPQATGAVLSTFFAGYALMQIPGGMLADRFGSKKVILTIMTLWSLFPIAIGFAWALAPLLATRFLFGLWESGYNPSVFKLISETFEVRERGKAISVVLSMGPISSLILPVIATTLLASFGWRSLFFVLGAVGFTAAVLFHLFLKPHQGGQDKAVDPAPASNHPVSIKEAFKIPMVWLLFIAEFGLFTVLWGTLTWLPTYLFTERHLDLKTLGWVAMTPGIAGIVSMYLTGYIFDRLKKSGWDKNLAAASMIGCAVFLMLMYSTQSLAAYVIFLLLLALLYNCTLIIIPSIIAKYLPREIMATTNGITEAGISLAGFISPLAIGFLVQASDGRFMSAFAYMAAFGVISAVSLLLVRYPRASKTEA